MKLCAAAFSRRNLLKNLGVAGAGLAVAGWRAGASTLAQEPGGTKPIENFTGPGANPHWNSLGPYLSEPGKVATNSTDRPACSTGNATSLFSDGIHTE